MNILGTGLNTKANTSIGVSVMGLLKVGMTHTGSSLKKSILVLQFRSLDSPVNGASGDYQDTLRRKGPAITFGNTVSRVVYLQSVSTF